MLRHANKDSHLDAIALISSKTHSFRTRRPSVQNPTFCACLKQCFDKEQHGHFVAT